MKEKTAETYAIYENKIGYCMVLDSSKKDEDFLIVKRYSKENKNGIRVEPNENIFNITTGRDDFFDMASKEEFDAFVAGL